MANRSVELAASDGTGLVVLSNSPVEFENFKASPKSAFGGDVFANAVIVVFLSGDCSVFLVFAESKL